MKRRLVTAFLLTLATFEATTARAQQPQPSLSDRETARSLMEDGDAKRDKGDWRGALKSYEAADAIMHVPTTGYEVGRAQAQLGLLLEARETLGRVLRIPSRLNEPAPFVQARKSADALNADLATRIPSVQLVLSGAEPARAQVTVDGEPIPAAAIQAPRKVNPGAHVIVVRSGTLEKKQDVTVSEREAKQVPIELKAAPIATSDPIAPPPEEAKNGNTGAKVLMFGGFGIGLVALGVGSITGLMHLSKTSDIKDQCSGNDCPSRVSSDLDSAKTLGDVATASFIVSGVGIAAGVVGLVLSKSGENKPAKDEKSASIRPILAPSYAGLAGTF